MCGEGACRLVGGGGLFKTVVIKLIVADSPAMLLYLTLI